MKIPTPEPCSPMNPLLHPLGVAPVLLGGHSAGLGTGMGARKQPRVGSAGWAQEHCPSRAEGQASPEGNWIPALFELSIFIIYFLLILILKYCPFILIPSLLPGLTFCAQSLPGRLLSRGLRSPGTFGYRIGARSRGLLFSTPTPRLWRVLSGAGRGAGWGSWGWRGGGLRCGSQAAGGFLQGSAVWRGQSARGRSSGAPWWPRDRPPGDRGPGCELHTVRGRDREGSEGEGGGRCRGPCRLGPGPSPPRPPLLGGSRPGRREAELREVEGGERVRSRQVTSETGEPLSSSPLTRELRDTPERLAVGAVSPAPS